MSDTEKLVTDRRLLQKQSRIAARIMLSMIVVVFMILSNNVKTFAAEQDEELALEQELVTTAMTKADEKTAHHYSVEEILALVQVVYGEASGETMRGQTAVASVVLNRFFSSNPGWAHDSIVNVASQSGQFHMANVSLNWILENHPEVLHAVGLAIQGYDPTGEQFPEGALYFHADWKRGVQGGTSIVTRSSGTTMIVIDHQDYYYDYV